MNKSSQKFQKVGKIKDAQGLKGEVFVLIFSRDTTWANQLIQVHLESPSQNDLSKTLKVERVKAHKEGLIVKLEGINDRNQSEALRGWSFSIPQENLISQIGETIYLKEIQDFEVFLKDQSVGYVKSFGSNGTQDLLVIRNDHHSFEVPFVSDFILKIDFETQKLFMDFPEGLMNLDEIE